MDKINPKVDEYLETAEKWQEEMIMLRKILLDCDLVEEIKWDKPCYTFEGKNIVVIQGFKEYCALLFLKGVLLKDPNDILIKTGENTEVGRQIRFTDVQKVDKLKTILKKYIKNAIEVERKGLKLPKNEKELVLPEELENKFEEMPELKEAWDKLTPGRQRGYVFYFSGSKQPKTREARIEKYIDRIMDGIGLNDLF